jgi:flavin-binding protein dodecin
VIELIASSSKGWDDATAIAVREAAKTERNITGVERKRHSGKIEDNRIVEYRAAVKISFDAERELYRYL